MVKKMKEGAILLTKTEAKRLVDAHDGMVHTFYNPGFGLIGGDHEEASILKDIESAKELHLAGEQAQNMHHALVILSQLPIKQSEMLFVATKDEEVKKLLKALH